MRRADMSLKWLRNGLFAALSASLILAELGCSLAAREQNPSQDDYRVLLPWSVDGKYQFHNVDLHSLLNLSSLKSETTMFLLSPSLSGKQLVGYQPRVRTFVNQDGVHVPTDELSLELLTLYAHLEKLEDLDEAVGLGQLLPKPRVVGVEVRIPQKQSKSQNQQVENNALYSPQLDALLFVPYHGPDLPLAVNAGVVAHEHFHALFNYLVLKPARAKIRAIRTAQAHSKEEKKMISQFAGLDEAVTTAADQMNGGVKRNSPLVGDPKTNTGNGDSTVGLEDWEVYHINLLRAVNEGLADVWGWVYSGDKVFVRRSIPALKATRDLEASAQVHLYNREVFQQLTVTASYSGMEANRAYELGTQYARLIKMSFEPALKKSSLRREALGMIVAKVLPRIRGRMETLEKGSWVKPSELIDMVIDNLNKETIDACATLVRGIPDLSEAQMNERCSEKARSL